MPVTAHGIGVSKRMEKLRLCVNCLDLSACNHTINIAHNMSATTEGHNQPYFINSENRCGTVRFCRTLNGSWSQKHVFVLSIQLFSEKHPTLSACHSQRCCFFTWKIFLAVSNLTPTDGCLTRVRVVQENRLCTWLIARLCFIKVLFFWVPKASGWGKNANNGADAVLIIMAIIWFVEREINCSK